MEDVWTLVHHLQQGQTIPGHPHEISVRDGTNVQTYINIQHSTKTCLTAFEEQHHILSAVLSNRKDRVKTNWHYYKFNFEMGINKTRPILEPLFLKALLEPIYDHDTS
jgi:hypothetical protein